MANMSLDLLLPVPSHAVVKLDSRAAKAVQRAAYCQVDSATAQPLYAFQVVQVPPSSRVRHGNRTPLGQP